MIFIWRRWGILAVLIPAVCVFVSSIGIPKGTAPSMAQFGIGMLLGGVIVAGLGWYLNMVSPVRSAATKAAFYRHQLDERIAQQLPLSGGLPMPGSVEEARMQADGLVAEFKDATTKGYRNSNSLFWIPMHFWGAIEVLGGLALLVVGLVTGAGPVR